METSDSITLLEHPMLTQEYAIYTPPIAEFFNVICEWIDNKVPGGYVYGMSRLGKSRAIKFWMRLLIQERYQGRVAFFHMHYRQHERPSELLFLGELLSALENIFETHGTKAEKFKRTINHMCTRAQNLKTNYVMLMIDEAQFMHEQEYQWLCNIHNELDRLGYRFTVVSVGSHELTYQHEVFAMAESAYLMARFMVRSQMFHGIRNQAELEYVLNGYDEQSEWPEHSGISFTQYFFPRAFKAGFRIADVSECMWNIFVDLAPERIQKYLNIPMEHIAKSVEYLFRELSFKNLLHVQINEDLIRKSIKQTAYEQHMYAISLVLGRNSKDAKFGS
jgi:hypothetical protein